MISVVYTGEDKEKITQELSLLECLNNNPVLGYKTLLFVEPELEQKFLKAVEAKCGCATKPISAGGVLKYMGYDITNARDMYKKRNTKTVTKKEIAEKFGIDVEYLNIIE